MSFSKAKSGLTATRQYWERVTDPPNSYVVGATSFISAIRDGRGHAEYHIAAVNDSPFRLQVRHSYRPTGSFTEDQVVDSVVDPVTGLHTAEIVAPVVKRYLRAYVLNTVLGDHFELGWYFQPRASGPVQLGGAGGGGSASQIVGNVQVQVVETETALGASQTFNGSEHDMLNYEGLAASLHLVGGAAGTIVQLLFQARHSSSAVWRTVETHNIVVGAGSTVWFSRVWAALRRYHRIVLVNTAANALAETELVVLKKPVA